MYNKAENIPTNADSTGHWKALYAGAAGDVKVDMFGNDGPLIFTMVAGGLLPVRITKYMEIVIQTSQTVNSEV